MLYCCQSRALLNHCIAHLGKLITVDLALHTTVLDVPTTQLCVTASCINCSMQVAVATSKQIKQADGTAKRGLQWDIPLLLSKSREGSDRNKIQCMVFDFVVHPDTCRMALNNARFKVEKRLRLAQDCLLCQCPAVDLLSKCLCVLTHRNLPKVADTGSCRHELPRLIVVLLQCIKCPVFFPFLPSAMTREILVSPFKLTVECLCVMPKNRSTPALSLSPFFRLSGPMTRCRPPPPPAAMSSPFRLSTQTCAAGNDPGLSSGQH